MICSLTTRFPFVETKKKPRKRKHSLPIHARGAAIEILGQAVANSFAASCEAKLHDQHHG
jgi:hypothetical protein